MNVLKGLYYSEDHEWIKVEGNKAKLGVTDHAQHELGDIVYIELPEVGAEIGAGDVFGVIESVKAASDSYSPVTGVVTAVNDALTDAPDTINSAPYDSWIFELELSDPSELEGLMDAEAYEAFIAE
jgi:glycine cleavage system H protein